MISGTRYYLFCDQRGCPERVVDDLGVTVWEAHVEPNGTAHIKVGRDFYQPLRFPGHFWDPELGFHYNRFRYYSPWLGRYLQVDPIGEQGGPNVYAYPARPLSQVDVDGLTNSCGGDDGDPGNGRSRRNGGDRPDRAGAKPSTRAGSSRRKRGDHIFAHGLRSAAQELREGADELPARPAARIRQAADELDAALDHPAFERTVDTGPQPADGDAHSVAFGDARASQREANDAFNHSIMDAETAPSGGSGEASARLNEAGRRLDEEWSSMLDVSEDPAASGQMTSSRDGRLLQDGRGRLEQMRQSISSMVSDISGMYNE